jgi:SAM-dependent methyltransferase
MTYQAFAHVYDRLMADMPYEDWVRFLQEYWRLHHKQPGTLVDLGCGTGTIAMQLANDGWDVTGIDVSDEMLAIAQDKQEGRLPTRGTLRYIHQDMREWDLGTPVDCVISFCDCLNYLTEPEDIVRTFGQTYAGLAEGGRFLFDVHSPYTLREYGEEQPFVNQDEDISYIWTSAWDEDRLEITHDLSIFIAGEDQRYDRIDEIHVQRAYTMNWLLSTLRDIGFVDVLCFADFTLEPPDAYSRRWFMTARKPGSNA